MKPITTPCCGAPLLVIANGDDPDEIMCRGTWCPNVWSADGAVNYWWSPEGNT